MGVEGFTIGQRRGLGIAVGEPRYVVGIEPVTRTITVGPRQLLRKRGLEASRFNWQVDTPTEPIRCFAQIRSQHVAVSSRVEVLAEERVRVVFDDPQSAVTPGQVVALYDGDLVLGGGWIERALDAA
jgi:tRNA-specific 2-thiouridylase